jgi:glycosyltransferase involved in cell wall biosynthesis
VDVYAERLGRALARLGHEISFLALDSSGTSEDGSITLSPEEYAGYPVWRLKFAFSKRPKTAFDSAYDPEMGEVVEKILRTEKPDLFIILNFYLLTLSSVQVAKSLGIPVVHIATDFVPICRRATFIRWNGESCQVGESIKSCSECFVSHRLPGRIASTVLNRLIPENTLANLAENRQTYKSPNPLSLLKPYWEQVSIITKRLEILKPLRQMIDLVVTPTQYTSQMFLSNGFNQDQVHFLPFAVEQDNPLESVQKTSSSFTRFLFIGRLQPYKGAHVLVEAFNKLQNPQNATLTIYGKQDGYETYYDQLTSAMASNAQINFAGSIPPSELGNAFADADYFILPSTWHENNPLILLDALQSNTPVIASDIGGVRDVVKDSVNGFLFPMGDANALQKVLQHTIDNPSLHEQMTANINLPYIEDYAQTILKLCQEKIKTWQMVGERL